ncbi:hypothetical protein K3217_30955 [bacterium BD-1]|nr:hypothetical protein [Ottowia caeni]
MNTSLIIVFAVSIIAVGIYLLIAFLNKKMGSDATPAVRDERKDGHAHGGESDTGCDLAIIDEFGIRVLEAREIAGIPAKAHRVESSKDAINRVRHIAADLFKGVTSVPNRTVEIVFKPEIHQGLADGTYTLMRTKTGEVLADAVDSSGSVVGKARLVEGSKAKQLAGGAFQLVSIAVAQSHLADIERSLGAIKGALSEALKNQENEDKARISGSFDYLREIAVFMKELRCPDELSLQKRVAIEGIIKDSHVWRNKLEEDMKSLCEDISNLRDLDTFGTGDTFEQLKILVERIGPILKRRQLFLDLASAIDLVTRYLDPAQREFSRIDVNEEFWADLISRYQGAVLDRGAALMGKAFWNSNDTLQLRRDWLRALASEHQRAASDQQDAYLSLQRSLNESMAGLIGSSGDVRVAISFNSQGGIDGAAVL